MLTRFAAAAVALVFLVTSGLIHGVWTERWSRSSTLQEAGNRLNNVPLLLPDWKGTKLPDLDEAQIRKAGIVSYLLRRYENAQTGQALQVLLVCGRPGHIAVHTPDVCYQGAGFGMTAPPVHQSLTTGPAAAADAWAGNFRGSDGVMPVYLRILWSWSDGDGWRAPENPRLRFAGSPVLYKLYVIRPMTSSQEPLDGEQGMAFLRQFLPELDKALFARS
jgi:hypothetical protein